MSTSRRTFLTASLAAATAPAQQTTARRERVNLLMIMADQHRGDCLSCDGHPAVKTPHLDRLAREGARFRHAYSSTPTCTPARSGLLTGLSPWNHGMLGYGRVAERHAFTKPQALRDAGYFTMAIGKNHFSPQRNPHGYHQLLLDESGRVEVPEFRSDYRSWFAMHAPHRNPDETGISFNDYRARPYVLPEHLHPTVWTGDAAVSFLNNYDRDQPFYLKVSFARPHSPYDPPPRIFNQYEGANIPARAEAKWSDRNRPRNNQSNEIWRGDLGNDAARHSRQGYYGVVSQVDEQVGRILETLEKRGLLERTLIVYFSDHGDMTGDHHLWRKSYAYEPSARIPMILRWPTGLISANRGQVNDTPVEIRDILTTLLDAAGAPTQRQLDGISLLAAASGKAHREFIDLEHDVCYDPSNHWNALTDGKWKYIYHARDGEEQLFHLAQDPLEVRDLAGDSAHSATLRQWRGRMLQHLTVRGEPFVKGGNLAMRPERFLYSPNFPRTKA